MAYLADDSIETEIIFLYANAGGVRVYKFLIWFSFHLLVGWKLKICLNAIWSVTRKVDA